MLLTEGGGDAILLQRARGAHDDRLRRASEPGPQLRRSLPQALRRAGRLVVAPDAAHWAGVVALQHGLQRVMTPMRMYCSRDGDPQTEPILATSSSSIVQLSDSLHAHAGHEAEHRLLPSIEPSNLSPIGS